MFYAAYFELCYLVEVHPLFRQYVIQKWKKQNKNKTKQAILPPSGHCISDLAFS